MTNVRGLRGRGRLAGEPANPSSRGVREDVLQGLSPSDLQNQFYLGFFVWRGTTYRGNHEALIGNDLFQQVQQAFRRHNQGKYRKHEIAFRGLLSCAHDGCTVTAELKKGKYVYYRCSGYRGKCATPRFREEEMSDSTSRRHWRMTDNASTAKPKRSVSGWNRGL